MALISVSCPQCAARYKIDEAHRGRKCRCKSCTTSFVVGDAPASPPLAAPAAPSPAVGGERPRGVDGLLRDWEPGDVVLDLYEVLPLPGTKRGYAEGGMGRVNLVRHRGWDRDLAVKSVLPARSASARDIDNFLCEAEQWVDKIGLHPHVVSCHYVRVLGGLPRVFIEYVDGGTLQEWISSKRLYEGGPQAALQRILDVAIQTAWGLHYVHELGLIHQDVKPLNVMMTADGVAKVTDFGLAGARAAAFEGSEQQPAGQTILATWGGMTPAYCSPEQAEVAAKRKAGVAREQLPKLTRRTDIWSWAVSVLHMFLGKVAWPGGQVAHLALQGEPDEPHLPPLPTAVKDLLGTCLRRRPEDRPHDLMQVADALQGICRQAIGQGYPREKPRVAEAIADTLNNRAVSMLDLGKETEAEQLLNQARTSDSKHPAATYNLGLLLWRSIRMTDQLFVQQMKASCEAHPDLWEPPYHLGLVHLERGDLESSAKVLEEVARQAPTEQQVQRTLEAVQRGQGTLARRTRAFTAQGPERIRAVGISPDGRRVLSGSKESIRTWDLVTGECLSTFSTGLGKDYVAAEPVCCFSPDGKLALFAHGLFDPPIRLLDIEANAYVRTLKGHPKSLKSACFSADGRLLATGGSDGMMKLWDVATGSDVRTFDGERRAFDAICFSPDGQRIVSGSGFAEMRLWDSAMGRCVRNFEGRLDQLNCVCYSPDGSWVLSGTGDAKVRLWEITTGKCVRTFEGHTDWVTAVCYSPDGRTALSASNDNTLRFWDLATGRCLRTVETEASVTACYSSDGSWVLSGGRDVTLLRTWDAGQEGQQRAPALITRPVSSAASTALRREYDEAMRKAREAYQSGTRSEVVKLLREAQAVEGFARAPETLELGCQLAKRGVRSGVRDAWNRETLRGHTAEVRAVCFSPDGRQALSAAHDNTFRLWDLATGRCLRVFEGHKDPVVQVGFTPDGLWALSASYDNTVRLWEVATGQCVRKLKVDHYIIGFAALSPDARWALSHCYHDHLCLCEVATGRCLKKIDKYKPDVISISFTRDGRLAMLEHEDKLARLRDVVTGDCLYTFEGYAPRRFSPDGRLALAEGEKGILQLWEVATGRCLRSFASPSPSVISAFSPDGRWVVSGHEDKNLRLWESATGRCAHTLTGHTEKIQSLCFSPDGRWALSGSKDCTVKLWELDWELEMPKPRAWDEGARPYLEAFLVLQTPYKTTLRAEGQPTPEEIALALARGERPRWQEKDLDRLMHSLGNAGYGWLRPEGVHRELERMAQTWPDPPPIPGRLRGWLDRLLGR